METLRDVLLYLVRNVPAGLHDLAAMERVIGEHFPAPAPAPDPAPAAEPVPAPAAAPAPAAVPVPDLVSPQAAEHADDAVQYAQFREWQAAQAAGHHGDVPGFLPDPGASQGLAGG
jgi:hypothetical protein